MRPALASGNVAKTMAAPVTAIVAYDAKYYDKMSRLVPHAPDAGRRIGGMDAEGRRRMALLSATLQGGYIILAAHGLGLDCGPMGGFDAGKVDDEFVADGQWKSIFLPAPVRLGSEKKRGSRAKRLPQAGSTGGEVDPTARILDQHPRRTKENLSMAVN